MAKVLLFREPSPGPAPDRYETVLRASGYHAKCVPVLHTRYANIATLTELLLRAGEEFSGVIITSKRACDALGEAFQGLCSVSQGSSDALAFWSMAPFYVVGEATASALRHIQTSLKAYGFSSIRIRGQSSGTGDQLGKFIENEQPRGAKSLLFLVGDKNRDTISNRLDQAEISFRTLQVYETVPRPDFAALLEDAAKQLSPTTSEQPPCWWMAYFAPSTASFVLPALQHVPELSKGACIRNAAIGPTTATFLEKDLQQTVHAVAGNPKPEDLANVIANYDREHPA